MDQFTTRLYEAACAVNSLPGKFSDFQKSLERSIGASFNLKQFRRS